MVILGLNAFHGDSSACLVVDGELIAAAEEERFRRIKHWAGFPSESITYCLREAGLHLDNVDHIAINSQPGGNLLKKIAFTLKNRPDFRLVQDRLLNAKKRKSVEMYLQEAFPGEMFKGKLNHIDHHIAHLSSAFHVSPYQESVVVSIDGFGDFSSTAWGLGKDTNLKIDGRVYYPHSMGVFYQAITQYLGFPNYGDEYKMMGLAPYGKATYLNQMHEIVQMNKDGSFSLDLDYFIFHKEKIDYDWENGSPMVGRLYGDKLADLFGLPSRDKNDELSQQHIDIAHSAQKMYELVFFNLLNHLHEKYQVDNLCLAGGCAMNSVANGKIKRNTPYQQVYIQSAAGDAGGAIGAAFSVYFQQAGAKRHFVMDHAYLGPAFSEADYRSLLEEKRHDLDEAHCEISHVADATLLYQQTAAHIADGKVIGWFQGRMEWGPRALGNRSILGDPRRADMKDILNQKIKRRESFRPFAPSILRESVKDWFEEDDDVPFMMKVFQIREDRRADIPAVTHVDGSGRLQTVYEKSNPRYYGLIKAFADKTGIPLLLNTSFNENEPVVCQPAEALDCFLRTKMDVLVLGDFLIERRL